MGDKHDEPFQLSFTPSLKVDFQGSRVTSDGGLILVRELDEIRGCQRRRAAVARPDRPADRFGEDLGAWRSPDVPVADLRDGNAGRG